MSGELLYCAMSLVFLSWAVSSWARWARGAGGRGSLLLGVVLGAFGVDGLRLIAHKAALLPPSVWWAEPAVMMLVGGYLFYVLLRAWKSLERGSRRSPRLEDLLEEATAGPGESV